MLHLNLWAWHFHDIAGNYKDLVNPTISFLRIGWCAVSPAHLCLLQSHPCFSFTNNTSSEFQLRRQRQLRMGSFIERRTNYFIVNVRSGVSNSAVWFCIELWVGYIIDRLLGLIYNRYAVQNLARGHEMELRESRIPLFGNGLFANHDLSWPIILVRIGLACCFVIMNLGIDGIEEPKFETVSLHSRVVVGGGGCNNKSTSFVGWTLSKCTRYSLDRQEFNVTLPVFNLSPVKDKPKKFLVNQTTAHCMDGKEMKEEKVIVRGRWLRSLLFRQDKDIRLQGKVYLEGDSSTSAYPVGAGERYFLGSTVLDYSQVYKVSKVMHVKRQENLFTNGTLSAYCSPRTNVSIIEKDDHLPREGQTHLCYFLYSSSFLFNGIMTKLYATELGIGAKIRFSDAVVFDQGITFFLFSSFLSTSAVAELPIICKFKLTLSTACLECSRIRILRPQEGETSRRIITPALAFPAPSRSLPQSTIG